MKDRVWDRESHNKIIPSLREKLVFVVKRRNHVRRGASHYTYK